MRKFIGALTFLIGLGIGMIGGAALLAYAYQAAGLYPPDDATIKFIARERGCIGLWLDTYWFQARSFYEKQGYEVFGALDDYPRGGQRFFLKKSLV